MNCPERQINVKSNSEKNSFSAQVFQCIAYITHKCPLLQELFLKWSNLTIREKILLNYIAFHIVEKCQIELYAPIIQGFGYWNTLQDTEGKFVKKSNNAGPERTVRTVQLEENVLNSVEEDPSISVRKLAAQFHESKSSIHNILKEQLLLHSFHLQKVHELNPADFPGRIEYANWLFYNCNKMMATLLAIFYSRMKQSLIKIVVSSIIYIYGQIKPSSYNCFTVSTSISSNKSLARSCGESFDRTVCVATKIKWATLFRVFAKQLARLIRRCAPVATPQNLWFMHDGAPPHFSLAVREHVNNVYPNHWIGRGPRPWPSRSPDLNPLDFYLWDI